jgi:hypothetical protein
MILGEFFDIVDRLVKRKNKMLVGNYKSENKKGFVMVVPCQENQG